MSIKDNKALSRRLLKEVWDQSKPENADKLVAVDYTDNTLGVLPGREGFKQSISKYLQAFAKVETTVIDQIAERNKVVTRVEWKVTLLSDEQVTVTGNSIDQFSEGIIVKSWNHSDVPRKIYYVSTPPPLPPGPGPSVRVPPSCSRNQDCSDGALCINGICQIL
jgi:predicted SnoaL-like aldol condensation-catalyzing enzyme